MKTLLTIILGAIPATYACILPLFFGLLVGLSSPENGPPSDKWLAIGLALIALFGTLCLWIVAFRKPNAILVIGLILGTALIAPFAYAEISSPYALKLEDIPYKVSMVGPPIVALYWIGHSFLDAFFSENR